MIDPELKTELDALTKKIDATYTSVEKTRKWITWSAMVTLALIILPLLVLPFFVDSFLSKYSGALNF